MTSFEGHIPPAPPEAFREAALSRQSPIVLATLSVLLALYELPE